MIQTPAPMTTPVTYLASLGNDAVTAIAGYVWLTRQRLDVGQVILVQDTPDDAGWDAVRDRLGRYLHHQGARLHLLPSRPTGELMSALAPLVQGQLIANVTGGNKMNMLRVLHAAASLGASLTFLIDSHGGATRILGADSGQTIDTPGSFLPPDLLLNLYADLGEQHVLQPGDLTPAQRGCHEQFYVGSGQLVQFGGDRFSYVLRGTVPHILLLRSPHTHRNLQTGIRKAASTFTRLGGQLAQGYLAPHRDVSQQDHYVRLAAGQGLRVLEGPVRDAAAPAPTPAPALPVLGHLPRTLAVLLGAQPMPALSDFDPALYDRVLLLAGEHRGVQAAARRLVTLLDARCPSHDVRVLAVSNHDASTVRAAVNHAAQHTDALTLNLTGGTKNMALAATFAAPPDATLTYSSGPRVLDLRSERFLPRAPLALTPGELLAVQGVRLRDGSSPAPTFHPDLFEAAWRLVRQKGNHNIHEFHQLWNVAFPGQPFKPLDSKHDFTRVIGKAREYLVFWSARQHLGPEWAVIHEPTLEQLTFNPVTGQDEGVYPPVLKTPDLLLVRDQILYVAEVKPSFEQAFDGQHQEQHDTYQFGQTLGRFTVSLIIVTELPAGTDFDASVRERQGYKFQLYVHNVRAAEARARGLRVFPDDLRGP
ncbi:hypothetical protein [Deinococcus marmoris]|uniref:hypothetical protein n=1 Tax=Deinococcus marmoris TaxID=249408 RepID=UPI0012DF3A17|nr:hypothetical protein [Deinococcus marmoris]